MNAKLEKMAVALEASDDYRVLRRLADSDIAGAQVATGEVFRGIYLDVEAEGLDVERDNITELAMIGFEFTRDGTFNGLLDTLHYYNDPGRPIKPEITAITGITDDMVAGKSIDREAVIAMLKRSHLVVAHNASYDRQMLERYEKEFEKICWGCSSEQVPWKSIGVLSKRLETILFHLGKFYRAHNAETDCKAGVYALTQMVGERTGLQHVVETSRLPTWHVWAIKAPFETKDALKARGYYWGAEQKAWHKEIIDKEEEERWLAQNVYRRLHSEARFDKLNAFNRFSKRG
jgi:DNA polymerase-3 subunit epsilon